MEIVTSDAADTPRCCVYQTFSCWLCRTQALTRFLILLSSVLKHRGYSVDILICQNSKVQRMNFISSSSVAGATHAPPSLPLFRVLVVLLLHVPTPPIPAAPPALPSALSAPLALPTYALKFPLVTEPDDFPLMQTGLTNNCSARRQIPEPLP